MKFYRVNEWLQASFEVCVGNNTVRCYNGKTGEIFTHSFESFYVGALEMVLCNNFSDDIVEKKCIKIMQGVGAFLGREVVGVLRKRAVIEVVENKFGEEPTREDIETVLKALKEIRG